MIRIYKDNKKVYKSSGVSISEKVRDFKNEEPKRTCPYRDLLVNLIDQKKISLSAIAMYIVMDVSKQYYLNKSK